MRRTRTVCRHGLSMAAAAVLLTACSGSGDGDSDSSSASASTTSASASATGGAAASEFCTQAGAALSELTPAFTGQNNDPGSLAPALQEAADKVRAIHPPSELASDWAAVGDGIEQYAQIYAEVDPNDP